MRHVHKLSGCNSTYRAKTTTRPNNTSLRRSETNNQTEIANSPRHVHLHVLIKLGDSIVHPCAAYNESEDSPDNVKPQDKIEGAGAVAAAVIETRALRYHHCFRISHTVLARTILSQGVTQPLPLTRDGAKSIVLPTQNDFRHVTRHACHAKRSNATFETSKRDPFCRTYHRHGKSDLARTVANGCEMLRTVARRRANTPSTRRPPE